MDEFPTSRKRGNKDWVWWLIGAGVLYYLYSSGVFTQIPYGQTALLPAGPTTLADPYTSVQAGGQGYTIQSLATLSSYGPYSTVG